MRRSWKANVHLGLTRIKNPSFTWGLNLLYPWYWWAISSGPDHNRHRYTRLNHRPVAIYIYPLQLIFNIISCHLRRSPFHIQLMRQYVAKLNLTVISQICSCYLLLIAVFHCISYWCELMLYLGIPEFYLTVFLKIFIFMDLLGDFIQKSILNNG